MRLFCLFTLFFALSCSHHPIAQNPPAGTTCGSVKYTFEWKYCITEATDLSNKDVIYYFHGGGGSESDWIDPKNYTSVIQEIWHASGKSAPTVVAVSIGELWGFSDKIEPGKKLSSYDDFLFSALPDIEKNLLLFTPSQRTALGESMGGFNAAVISLRNPNLFSKVALVCPGVLRENIFSPDEMKAYIESTGAQKSYTDKITHLLNTAFDSAEQYQLIAPQALLRKFNSKKNPKLFVSCGRTDQFGFFTESKTFIDMALAKKMDVTWKPVPGNHCSLDIDALAEYLMK